MKTNLCLLNGSSGEIRALLNEVEKCTAYNELSPSDSLKIRLLAEELTCMLPALLKSCSGCFWAENDGNAYKLVVKVQADSQISYDVRQKAVQLASDGKNDAFKGIMGKVRMVAETLLYPTELLPDNAEGSDSPNASFEAWNLNSYKESIKSELDEAHRLAAWDELEMSIIPKLADNVTVSVYNRAVTITVYKTI